MPGRKPRDTPPPLVLQVRKELASGSSLGMIAIRLGIRYKVLWDRMKYWEGR